MWTTRIDELNRLKIEEQSLEAFANAPDTPPDVVAKTRAQLDRLKSLQVDVSAQIMRISDLLDEGMPKETPKKRSRK
jgi:hypothetical protein